jgi:CHRD domain
VRKHLLIAEIVTTALVLSPLSAGASDRRGANHFKVDLVGFQEVPSISTTGHAHLELTIDDEAQTIEFEMTFADLEGVGTTPFVTNGVVTASHIHIGARGTNGGVSVFFCGGGGQAACPPISGTISGVITPANIVGPAAQGINPGEPTAFAELVRAIRAGFAYANLHTTRFPTGEIRGQINDRDEDR